MHKHGYYNDLFNYYDSRFAGFKSRQLYTCMAYTAHDYDNDMIVLRSYSTIVALYDIDNQIVIERKYYSNTTTQHVAKFRYLMFREFNLSCKPPKIRLEYLKESR